MTNSKNKRLFTLFAILFVAIFAVGCVFSAACGKKNKEEEEPHSHSYTSTVTKEATCTEDGETTYTCDCGDTYTEAIPALGHDWGAWTEVTAADCVNAGSQTRSCSRCDATENDVIAALGHDYTVVFTWAGSEETGYTGATATATCSRGDSTLTATDLEVNFDAPNGTIYGDYTASVTIDGKDYSETKTITDPNAGETQDPTGPSIDESNIVLNQYVDFGDSETYEWIGDLDNDKTFSDGVLTLVTAKGSANAMAFDTENGRLKAGGSATSGNGRYFIIDLSKYIGDVVEIKIVMRTNTSNDGISDSSTTLYLTNNVSSTSSALASVTSYKNAETDPKTLTYVAEITEENAMLYTLSDANMHYYSISVRASGDVEPAEEAENPSEELVVSDVSLNISNAVFVLGDTGYTLTATATVASGTLTDTDYVWTSGDGVVSVTGTGASVVVTPVTEGTTSVVVTVGGKTATCAVTVYAEDPALGTWAGKVSFGLGLYSGYLYTVTSLVNIIVDSTNGKNTFTLLIDDLASENSLASTVLGMIEGLFENGALAVFEDFDWVRNIDGSYTVEDKADGITINATIDENGELAVVYNGTFDLGEQLSLYINIDASVGKYDAATSPVVADVVLSDSEISVYENKTASVSSKIYTTLFSDTYNGTYSWTVDGTGVISIEGEANTSTVTVKGVSAGTATLTLTVEDMTKTCAVTVMGVGSVVISGESWYEPGAGEQKAALTATVTMKTAGEAYGGEYTWTSSNTSVATVASDSKDNYIGRTIANTATLTIVGEGTTVITCTLDNGSEATFTVTVTDVISLPTDEDVENYLTIDDATFTNQDDVQITKGENGTYTVTGTASIMGDAEKAWWGTDTNDAYVVIKIYVPKGYSVAFNATDKLYENWEGGTGASAFDGDFMFVVVKLSEDSSTKSTSYTIKAKDATAEETYTVDYSGVTIPDPSRPEMVVSAWKEETEFNGATFTNQTDVSFEMTSWSDGTGEGTSYPWAYIEAYGTASAMKEAQVTAFETDDPIGTGYVIVSVLLHPGDTVWYASGAKSYRNDGDDDEYYGIIVALGNYGYYQFMVSSTDQMYEGMMYVIDFSGMTHAEISGEVESAADLKAALDAGVTEITLTANVTDTADSAVITAINNVLADATSADEAVTVIINLGGNTLDTSGSSYGIVIGNYNTLEINGDQGKLILWTNASSSNQKSDGAIYVDSGSTLIINDTVVTSTGTAIFPRADSSEVKINGSVIYTTGYYGISTNAGTGMSDKVAIEVEKSLVYANEETHDCAAIMLNVEGTLNVKESYIVGGRQGIILRANGSVATIKDTAIAVSGEYTSSPYANEDGTPNSNWSSGNEVPNAAVVLGNNTTSTSWDGTTTVEFEGVTLKVLAGTPASAYFLLYAYSSKEGNSVAITMTGGGNNFSVEYLGLNNGVYAGVGENGIITVNDTELTAAPVVLPSIHVDFSDEATYSWITNTTTDNGTTTLPNETTYTNGILSLKTSCGTNTSGGSEAPNDSMTIKSSNGKTGLSTAGSTSGNNGRYFAVDLTTYTGNYVKITAVIRTGSNNSERMLAVATDYSSKPTTSSNFVLEYAMTSSNTELVTLTYVAKIEDNDTTLYLTCDNNIYIFSLDIEVSADEIEAPAAVSTITISADTLNEGTLELAAGGTAALTVSAVMTGERTYSGTYTWTSSDTSIVTVEVGEGGVVTVTAVAAGEATVTVRLCDANGRSASVTVTVTATENDN